MSTEKSTNATARLLGEGWLIPLAARALEQRVPLENPVRHGTQELRELVLVPLAAKHLRDAPPSWDDHGKLLNLAGKLTGLPDVVLDQLQGGDVVAVVDATLRALWPVLELPGNGHAAEPPRPWPEVPAPHTLELEHPVRSGGDARSRLVFQAITGKVMRKLPTRLELRHLPMLVEQLTGAPAELVDELAGADLNRALGVAQCFFACTPATGAARGRGSPSPSAGG